LIKTEFERDREFGSNKLYKENGFKKGVLKILVKRNRSMILDVIRRVLFLESEKMMDSFHLNGVDAKRGTTFKKGNR